MLIKLKIVLIYSDLKFSKLLIDVDSFLKVKKQNII